ncbi:MAG: 7-carboxy-7-deazaguanine synthase QueE [Cyanobacteria bacterium P01_F01_bin.42]
MPQPSVLTEATVSGEQVTANLVEIFSAIQGEGVNVGTRQLFVRFGGCDLRCRYCDSVQTWRPTTGCEIEIEPGKRVYEQAENPVSQAQLIEWITRLNLPYVHDSISFTGGEPLLHSKFLQEFLPLLKRKCSLPIYLETGGHRDRDLERVLPYVDMIGMDMKLPSVSGETLWDAHRRFLRMAHGRSDIFCKLIISNRTTIEDLQTAAEVIASVDNAIACFLQPMTPVGRKTHEERLEQGLATAPSPDQVLDWQVLMKRSLRDVRVIPQTHKMIDQK